MFEFFDVEILMNDARRYTCTTPPGADGCQKFTERYINTTPGRKQLTDIAASFRASLLYKTP